MVRALEMPDYINRMDSICGDTAGRAKNRASTVNWLRPVREWEVSWVEEQTKATLYCKKGGVEGKERQPSGELEKARRLGWTSKIGTRGQKSTARIRRLVSSRLYATPSGSRQPLLYPYHLLNFRYGQLCICARQL